MISKIVAHGFKGFTGEQPLSERTLFVGPNGAGKTARSQALQLAVNGHIIGCGKTNDDILSAFGEGDTLSAGGQIDGKTTFARKLSRSADGKVSQKYYVENAPVSKDFFLKALGESGAPVILNVADFMALSDNKKLETLFNLYPPAGDVAAVQGKIDATKDRINALTQKVKTTEQAAARIASSKTEIKIPAGTLAEVDAEIKKLEGDLAQARNELVTIKIEEQKAESERKAKETAERKEQERLEAEKKKVEIPPVTQPGLMEQEVNTRFGMEGGKPIPIASVTFFPDEKRVEVVHFKDVQDSIQAIITALESAGCGACAARLIAKRELKKYTGGAQ